MQDIGAAGCLVDSVIDLRHDRGAGLLGFKPTIADFGKLYFSAFQDGLRVWARRPSLTFLFLEAVLDNIRDRNRPDATQHRTATVLDGKDEAASVA